jgi:hypothetical protein
MARYIVGCAIYIKAAGDPAPRTHNAGEVITLPDNFPPSNCLMPLDLAAKAARARVMAKRGSDERYRLNKRQAWFRRGLTRATRNQLAAAERAMEAADASR